MPAVDIDVSRWVVATSDTELMVTGLGGSVGDRFEDPTDGEYDQNLQWTLRRFQDRFGSTWVPGRVTLSPDALRFRPRESTTDLSSPTLVALHLQEVLDINTDTKLFNKLVRVVLCSGQTLTFRCRAPEVFAEQLRAAAGAMRALSA